MKKIFRFLFSLASLALVGSYMLSTSNNPKSETTVASSKKIAISSSGDSFALLDNHYAANESFVYTADLHFRNGQAGGLAFGAKENEHYYVLNMDRVENRVKLLYFASNGVGGYNATELVTDWFIGNDKITDSELSLVKPKVATIENVNLKVVLTVQDEHAYAEFFVEGIKRFGIDRTIDLNDLGTEFKYEGGYLGMNCFNGDVYLNKVEIGKSDYSYFSEPYRNQYHLQPFAKWTNDPNALCYYNGYYHVFYQTNPFGLQWGDMYWGHARSRDLIHFEFLPICLFPEGPSPMQFGEGDGYMWSGCAITYTQGMSSTIDNLNWFPNGNGNGIVAIYTREGVGEGGLQNQVVISSDDEGLTWTKRSVISQTLTGYNYHVDWRDPKVFPLQKNSEGKVTRWGMTLSSMNLSKGWFLTSTDLVGWSIAGTFNFPAPECIGVGYLTDPVTHEEFAYLTNKSRTYILGKISYDQARNVVTFNDEDNVDISTYTLEQIDAKLKPLDFGPDTYASQSFYISDPLSEYYGKDIVLNWFSGDLNASFCTGPGEYAGLRERWNGGFTIPVEYGVTNTTEGRRITQKPITVNNDNLEKTELLNITDEAINENSDNVLKDVHTHIFELSADITSNNNSPITFKVDVGEDEYMQFGWNATDGYYVDRTYLDDKGINTNVDWHAKYTSHIMGESDRKTFYVLSDNGGLEVFCEDFSISFYFVTTASMYSTGASLMADDATINSLEFNEVKSAYRHDVAAGEGLLYVSSTEVSLDNQFTTSKFVTCWYSGVEDLAWELVEGEGIVDYQASNEGINIVALQEGDAKFRVSAGNQTQYITVHVYTSNFQSDLSFKKENVVSGQWVVTDDSIVGERKSGNGFLLANESGSDFTYTGQFQILEGTAASLVFRAATDMSSYLVANYDNNEKVVKLWSKNGELARSNQRIVDTDNIVLSINAQGKDIRISINGENAINYTLHDNEPLQGRFGINVFSGKARFKSFSIAKEDYEYSNGNLEIKLAIDQFVVDVFNVTQGNTRIESGFYYQANGALYIREAYFDLLDNGTYTFRVVGASYIFTFKVEVNHTRNIAFEDLEVEKGIDVTICIGNMEVNSLQINGEVVDISKYSVRDYSLRISKDCFKEGDNTVQINDTPSFKVKVVNNEDVIVNKKTITNNTPIIIISIVGGVVAVGATVLVLLVLKKRKTIKQ